MDCTRRFLAQAPENLYGPPEEILGLLPEAYRSICRRRGVPLRDEALRMIGSTLEIAVCILAGGRSSRMGRDKKNLCHRGRSFLRNAMDLLALYADRYLSLAADDPLDAPEGYRLIKDRFPAKGPAGGITEVLSGTRRPWALFIPCDMPLLTGPLLDELAGRRSEDLDAVMFSEDEEVRTFPLLLRTRTAAPAFGAALKEDRLKLRRILAHPLRVGIVRAESCASYRKGCLENINTREDYERLDAPTE
jgi:molybdopterin-guanine dinucleotide biosynthesis protein A